MLLPGPSASLLPGGSVHPWLGIPGHARLVPRSGHGPVSCWKALGKPPVLQCPVNAGQGRAAQPGALPALLSPSWTFSEALQSEKKSGKSHCAA